MSFSIKLSHISAGFLAVLVGYTSSVAIIFQAALTLGDTQAQLTSWFLALGMGMGVTSMGLSWWYRTPILTAWSTLGAALLVTSLAGVSMPEALGAFMLASVLMMLLGLTGWFDRVMEFLPTALASAILAGVLLQFGLAVFKGLEQQLVIVASMIVTYLLASHWWPRLAIASVLLVGLGLGVALDHIPLQSLHWQVASWVWTTPEFSWAAVLGVALPLFAVTLASQNLPGLAVLRTNGYTTPMSPLLTWTGLTGVVLAPFGGFAFNLAVITAAICMGQDADANP